MRNRNRTYSRDFEQIMERRQKNRFFFGIAVAVAGLVMLLHSMGLFIFDVELWPVILIVIGLMLGIKSGFRRNAWWILIFIGVAHLIPQFYIFGRSSKHFVWPIAIIIGGLMIAFRPRRKDRCMPVQGMTPTLSNESMLNIDVSFGGKKEVVTSKEFKGGTINVSFGGYELNLSQAEFTEPSVVLDFRVVCGGVEMVVPSHWEVRNEISTSFGSVEDGRTIQTNVPNEARKTLILRGSCSFGGIEIKSY